MSYINMAHACSVSPAPAVDLHHLLDLKPQAVHLSAHRSAASRATSPAAMSGYYSHHGDEMFSGDASGLPVFLEDVDAFAGSGYEQTPYTTQDTGAWSVPAPSTDAFGISFTPSYETGFPMDPQVAYTAQTAAYHDPSIGGSAYPMHYEAPPFDRVPSETEFLGPYGTANFSPHHSPASLSPNLSHMSSFSNITPTRTPNPNTLRSSFSATSPPLSTRSTSPNSISGLDEYGVPQPNGTWKCAFPGCKSTVTFARPCDLRKHYHRHEKRWYCRWEGCERSEAGAANAASLASSRRGSVAGPFTSVSPPVGDFVQGVGYGTRKDRDRHERTHNPGIECPAEGCERRFARTDNMRDHYRRIHASAEEKGKGKANDKPTASSLKGKNLRGASSSGSGNVTRRR
jgi:hypothetical protein